ncbi:zinc ribbon domain-containing protein [bacterium]|nr:zinc ribbon domain-containing protein [bacterium]
MPTYEYICDNCAHEFEEFQSITAPALERCPKCEGSVRRLISSGNGLIFKGSGFYITDYKKSSDSTSGESESVSKSKKSEKTAEKKTDTKSADSKTTDS